MFPDDLLAIIVGAISFLLAIKLFNWNFTINKIAVAYLLAMTFGYWLTLSTIPAILYASIRFFKR